MTSRAIRLIDAEFCKLESYIDELEAENERLRKRERELVDQLASYASTVDRMKMELIMGGALVKSEAP